MRKPKVNLAFGAENVKGISTILIEKHTIQECIQHTSIPTLDFISAGPTPPNPSELILSPRFDEVLAELHRSYDVILIDTPPVGLVTDGILIMRKADIPIYIVRANYSKKAFLKNINKLMRANNFTRLCTILNDATSSGLYGYGYGYSYGYGYGQGYYEDVKPNEGVVTRLRKRFS
jgi:capsular exopolysaccharide synthesis family protein